MLTSSTQIVWQALGRPAHGRTVEPADCLCSFCGSSCAGKGVPIGEAISDSFSDYRDLAVWGSSHCCEACVWAMAGRPPDTIRMWSLLWREDGKVPPSRSGCPWQVQGVHMSNKADLTAFRATLVNPPPCKWVMCLADSGQGSKRSAWCSRPEHHFRCDTWN